MRYLAIIALSWLVVFPVLGQITRAEYFIDRDPGIGKGIAVSVGANSNNYNEFTVPLANVTAGHHVLYMRARDTQGHWSQVQTHSFFVTAGKAANVSAYEYFIDIDPGMGKGTPITAEPDQNGYRSFTINLNNVSVGFHTLWLRSQDNLGQWSLAQQHVFYNGITGRRAVLTKAEYNFIGNNQTSATYLFNISPPREAGDFEFVANLADLESNREYALQVWVYNSEGKKSAVVTKSIRVEDAVTGIPNALPAGLTFQTFPNPVTGSTQLELNLPVAQHVKIVLQDVLGKKTDVITNKLFPAGLHKLSYDLKNYRAGMYICKLQGKNFQQSLKILKQ